MADHDERVEEVGQSAVVDGRRLAKGVAFFVLVSIVVGYLGWACNQKRRESVTAGAKDVPFVVLVDLPGYSHKPMASGLAGAIWADGAIVRVASGSEPGGRYVKGRLSSEQIERLKAKVDELGLSRDGDDTVVVDAASVNMYLRRKDGFLCRAEVRWHRPASGRFAVAVGGHVDSHGG